jgi:hypothetical protein
MNIKNGFFSLFYLLIILVFLSMTANATTEEQRIIQTYGEAEITAQPDLAKISLSIETLSQSAKEAVEENAKLANTVLKALIDFGLSEEEITTSSYRLNSYREWGKVGSQNEPEKIYYQATNEILVLTNQLDTVGQIIDLAVEAGINNIQYINFEIRDPQQLMLQALTMATEQAQHKAEAIAKGAGVIIKQLYNIKEERTFYAPFRLQDTMLQTEIAKSDAPTPIAPDSVIIKATVIAEFSF